MKKEVGVCNAMRNWLTGLFDHVDAALSYDELLLD